MKRSGERRRRRGGRGSGGSSSSNSNSILRRIKKMAELDRYVRPGKVEGSFKLDSNENFALDRDFVLGIAAEAAKRVDVREYPLGELDLLYSRLAKYTGISEKCIAAGSGSDQIIELLLSTLGGRRATVFSPTFSYFVNRCKLHGISVDTVPLDRDFGLDARAFVRSAKKSDLVYICSPNNPTGNQFDRQVVTGIIDSLRKSTLVLIDEAYADFAGYSLAADAVRRENVVVLRTLSKAFGLAGARVGYMVANEEFAGVFRSTIQSPYPISTLSLVMAAGVLERADYVTKTIGAIRSERERMLGRLASFKGVRAFKSDANFILVEAGSAKTYRAISEALAAGGIAAKMLGRSIAGHPGCMRVTVGTAEMNDRFLRCMEQGLQAAAAGSAATTITMSSSLSSSAAATTSEKAAPR